MLPYLARSLSKTDYATYGQSLLIVVTMTTIISAVFNKSLYLFLAGENKNNNAVLSSNLFIALLVSIGFVIGTYTVAPQISSLFGNINIQYCIRIYVFSILSSTLYTIINSYLIFKGRVKVSSSISVVSNLIKVCVLYWVINNTNSIESIFWVLLFISVAQLITALFFVLPRLTGISKAHIALGLQQAKLGLPLGLSAMIGTFILQADAFMISTMLNQEAYAMYRNGAWEIPLISTIYASISIIILPEITTLWKKQEFQLIRSLKSTAILSTACITFPILGYLLINSENIIVLLFSSTYQASWTVFAIFNLALLVRINDYSDIIIASGKTKLISQYYLIAFILNLILNYVLIVYFSYVGAAIATLFSLLCLAILQGRKSVRLLNTSVNDLFQMKKILIVLLISIVLYGLISIGVSQIITPLFLKLIFGGLLYFPLIYYIIYKLGFIHPKLISTFQKMIPFQFIDDKIK